jgi:hypothetical protein
MPRPGGATRPGGVTRPGGATHLLPHKPHSPRRLPTRALLYAVLAIHLVPSSPHSLYHECVDCDFQAARAQAARRLPDAQRSPPYSSAVLSVMRGWW